MPTNTPPLFGLILAGGASTRMGQDKAVLNYHGESQLQWTYRLLSEHVEQCFISVRPDQRDEPTRAALPQIVDRQPGLGPIAGIESALAAHPNAAWLILACDLPFISAATLKHLIQHREPARVATAYRSAHDGFPEPLCAIWEPRSSEAIATWRAKGKDCPRKVLINSDTALINLPEARMLDNINTPQEREAAQSILS
jgi:molybdenum cofactor guanylyltransferase